jgi:hypothetical protein
MNRLLSRARVGRGGRVLVAGAVVLTALLVGAIGTHASSPGSSDISVPTKAGQTVSVSWSGTIPPGTNPTNNCNDAGVGVDDHIARIAVGSRGYDRVDAEFTFQITWTPASPDEQTSDEILTVNGQKGADEGDTEAVEVDSSDGSDTTETVVAHNLPAGEYHALACGFVNSLPQPYTATLTVVTSAKQADTGLKSANAQGLAFGAAVPADVQRDEAEPLIEIDKAGNIYTCGPTGFSNSSDYAQVSTDGGDSFHLLGTPPRGQQSAGGGGDCGLATGIAKNAQGNYQYAYSGLGALSGFATSTSPDNGHSIATAGGDLNGGVTSQGALADRQWMTFTDDHTVLLSYNQQQPRNTVVQRSTDGGLTYSAVASVAAPNPEFPGPLRTIEASNTVYMPWTKGEEVNLAVSHDGGTTWTECRVAKGDTVKGGTAGFAVADHDLAGNIYVVWSDSASYHVWMSVLPAASLGGCNETVAQVRANKDDSGATTGQPSVDPGWSAPVQVDRDDVHTTVFPWVAAGGAPGRVAVAFYGTTSDGDPNSGEFDAAWNVYVNQSLNALDASRTFSQVQATTRPFHYDSICLNGLGCDLAAPAGDRSLADFFAIDLNPVTGKLSVVFDRTNKKPDEEVGHVATPMVVTQSAGPSNNGTSLTSTRPALRQSTTDPTGDALSSYSLTTPGTPVAPTPKNEAAADFTSATAGLDPATGGLKVTLKVASLSTTALTQALLDTGSQSLVWVWRFGNGYTDAGASAAWNPATGWTFGFDQYATGGGVCDSAVPGEKCQVYPQGTAISGTADPLTGTITLVVPKSLLRQLSGTDSAGRPLEAPADTGSRFYDGTAVSLGNTTSSVQAQQTFLYPLDETAAMDFLLPRK